MIFLFPLSQQMTDTKPSTFEELLDRLNPHPAEPSCDCAFCHNFRSSRAAIAKLRSLSFPQEETP